MINRNELADKLLSRIEVLLATNIDDIHGKRHWAAQIRDLAAAFSYLQGAVPIDLPATRDDR